MGPKMHDFKTKHTSNAICKVVVAALALALAIALTACGGQQGSSSSDSSDTGQATTVDYASWKTLGDVFAAETSVRSAGWDDNYYVCMIQVDDSHFRIIAKMDDEANKNLEAVDWGQDSEKVDKALDDAVAHLPLQSVEDVTGKLLSQDELDELVGKTGKELEEAGFVFQSYSMYGGEQTAADFAKDYFAYSFTFDVIVREDATEDGGASVADVKVVSAEFANAADEATDPSKVS